MRICLLLAAIAALAACNEAGLPSNDSDEQANAMQPPTGPDENRNEAEGVSPGGNEAAPANTSEPAGSADDELKQCGADEYQWLVGEPRSRIPEKPEGANWRVACTTCPVTMDYSPQRMNIFYDEESGTIETVKCG